MGVVQQQEHRLFPRGLLHVGAGLGAGDGVLPLGQVEHQAAALQLHLGKTALHNGQLVHALGDAVLGQAELRQQRHSGQRVVHVDGAGVGQGELPGAVGALHGHAACVLVNGADVVPGLRRSEPALGAVGPANVMVPPQVPLQGGAAVGAGAHVLHQGGGFLHVVGQGVNAEKHPPVGGLQAGAQQVVGVEHQLGAVGDIGV